MKGVAVVLLQIGLNRMKFGMHGFAPALPLANNFERHEVLAEDGGNENAVFFGYDFFGNAAFFFDEERSVAV